MATSNGRSLITLENVTKVFYTDEANSDQFRRALDHDLDNPFVCDDCKREYEELAYEDR